MQERSGITIPRKNVHAELEAASLEEGVGRRDSAAASDAMERGISELGIRILPAFLERSITGNRLHPAGVFALTVDLGSPRPCMSFI
jgi:hypothetical protein